MRLAVLIFVLLAAAAALADDAELETNNEVFNIGRVVVPCTVVYSQWLRAVGPDTVEISDIKSGCECIVVTHNGEKIAPGDSTKITVTWELGVRLGLTNRLVRVFTSESLESTNILFQAYAVQELEGTRTIVMHPFKFEFTQIGSISRDSISFALTNEMNTEVIVTPLTEIPGDLAVDLPDTLAPKEVFRGAAVLSGQVETDTLFPSLILQFNSAGLEPERITIPIRKKVYRRPAG